MYKLLITVLFLCTIFNTIAQEKQHLKGDILKDRLFLIDKAEISAVDAHGNFISIRPHRVNGTLRNYYVELFNELNFGERIEIKTQNATSILDVFILNNTAHVFIKEKYKDQISLRIDLINLSSKSYTHKTLLDVNKNEHPNIFKALKNKNNIALDYTSKLLLSFPVVEAKTIYTHLSVFNKNLELQFQKNVFPNKSIKNKNLSFLNASQANNSNYLLFSVIDENDKKYYQLIELNDTSKRELIIPANDDSYELINISIQNNNYHISGLKSRKRKGAYEGYTFYNINLDAFHITSQNQSTFLTENAQSYFKGLFKSKRDIDLQNIFIDKDLNTYLVGQFYKIREKQAPILFTYGAIAVANVAFFVTYNPISTKYKLYDDLLITKIDSKGNVIWDKLLELKQTPKIRSKSNKRDSSFYTYFDNNQVNIMMNGYINLEKDKLIVKQNKRKHKTNFYNITINPSGDIDPQILFSNSNSEIIFRAENSNFTGSNIYILGQGNMRKQLIKLDL